MILRAVKSYCCSYPDPLILRKGDQVTLLRSESSDSDWHGWHFCEDSTGNQGWISEDYVLLTESKGVITDSYKATELNADVGQSFVCITESFGWYWCHDEQGNRGWLPKKIF